MTRQKWCIVQQNSVEMDKVAHALEKGLIHENTDPEIEITNGTFSNGGTKLIKYYYDLNGKLVQRSKAKKVRVCEFNQEGLLLVENKVEIYD